MSAAEAIDVGRAAAAPRARRSPRFLLSELRLIFGRRRNIAGLGVLIALPIIIGIAVKVDSPTGPGGVDLISGIVGNGLFVPLAALTVEVPLFLPLAVSAIAGDSVAGEANLGTLRYLLTVPVGRTRLLVTKYAAIVVFAVAATLLVAVVGSIIGLALFGAGPMSTLSGTQISLVASFGRVLLVCGYLAAGFAALGAIGLFISTLTEQPIAATIATVLVNVIMFILNQISQLEWLHPWLLTHWWFSFGDLLRDPIATGDVSRGLITAAVYAVAFWLAAWARFLGKDVSS